ncbi:histidine-rich glycoprotein-like [Phlebotomus papatasi]|uniref:histidine-rich glycoprotein-like n=1 Tax=Phlebotomus papatasi TaxID=29031 RepID=UPI002483A269|nr:histidine-rich glycoprotein-like [Phlebotomus papatasi]
MKCIVGVLLLGAVIGIQSHYLPSRHHNHHAFSDLDQGEDYLWDDSHAEEPRKWTGPIHVPVIKDGVPTETPEVRHAKAHLLHKLAEAKSHPAYQSKEDYADQAEKWTNNHQHTEHHQSRWTGPTHVPVIEHGVPTETPEVRHAKAYLEKKFSESKKHSGYQVHEDKWQHHEEDKWSKHGSHHQTRWTGPIHVPVIEHGVPTETPEVRHAKAQLHKKIAEAKSHPDFHHEDRDVYHQQAVQSWHEEPHHDSHHGEHRWTGPVHVPVIENGVPTETPEVKHAKAHLHAKHAEARLHPHFNEDCDDKDTWQQGHKGTHHTARFVEAKNEGRW